MAGSFSKPKRLNQCNAFCICVVNIKKAMRTTLFSLFIFTVVLISCDKPVEETQYHFPVIELYHCADTSINGQTIQFCFDSVYDSRCPANMQCIWQGEVTVKLSLQIGTNQKQSFKLSTLNNPPAFRNDTTISGYKIKLLTVSSYPGNNSHSAYKVELSVTR
jgi:hypothetical protein